VVSNCNLVEEFNGLVSIKGPAQVGPFTFYTSMYFLYTEMKICKPKVARDILKKFSFSTTSILINSILSKNLATENSDNF
jgi:hypothetical protein